MKKIKINTDFKSKTILTDFIQDIPNRFEKEGKVIYDERNTIRVFKINGFPLIVKRFKQPLFVQRLVYSFFRPTKVIRAYKHAHELRKRGIETPQEIACIEVWKNGLFKDGYLVTEITYDQPIANILTQKAQSFSKSFIKQFASFLANLHKKGILHHDLNSTNVLYREEQENYFFSLIDINRMKIYPNGTTPPKEYCLENMTRFTKDYNVFKIVLQAYAEKRGWNIQETIKKATKIKELHDIRRAKRKAFFYYFKKKKQ